MIKKYKQFNEGIRHLLVGPSEEEIKKELEYRFFNKDPRSALMKYREYGLKLPSDEILRDKLKDKTPYKILSVSLDVGWLYGVKKIISDFTDIKDKWEEFRYDTNYYFDSNTFYLYTDIIKYLDKYELLEDYELRNLLSESILNPNGYKTFHYIWNNHPDIRQMFIKNVIINNKNILLNPILRNDKKMIDVLLKFGFYDNNKEYYFNKLIQYNHNDTAELFLENKQFNEGIKHLLVGPTEEEIFNYLELDKITDPDQLLIKSIEEGLLYGVKKALKMGANINYNSDDALGYACDSHNSELVEYLLNKGADIKNAGSDTLLQNASWHGDTEIVKTLLKYGADVHSDDDRSLRFAVEQLHYDTVKVLLKNGANVHVNDDYLIKKYSGYTDTKELVKLLKKYN